MKSFFVFAVCIGAVFAGRYGDDSNHYARQSQAVNAARRGVRYENFDNDNQQTEQTDDICRMCASRCGVSFATETISSGRPHTSIESQMGQSTSSLSSSSTISSSSGSNHGSHNTWHGSPAHGPPNDFQFTVVGPSNSLNRYITQSQKSAQEQLQSASSRDAAKSTTAIDHGQIEPLFSINHSPPSGVSSWSKAWEKSSSWSSQTNYDSNGHHSSSSHFTTGEGEDQTVNGKTTSHRAATTTLDDNGRRSTYTIRTQ